MEALGFACFDDLTLLLRTAIRATGGVFSRLSRRKALSKSWVLLTHLLIDNYSEVCRNKLVGRLSNVDLLIPSIQFRMGPETSSGQAVNIHVLTSPDAPDHEARICRALEDLNFQFTDGEWYRCTREELTKLGRAYSAPNDLNDKTAYCEGVKQFKVEFTKFPDLIEGQTWLHDNSLIFVAGGEECSGRAAPSWKVGCSPLTNPEVFTRFLFSQS